MKFFILCLIFVSQIFAVNLLTYNLYERSDRVDLMLSFDSPFDGKIFQDKKGNTIALKLNDLSYNKLIKKDINSKIVQKITIAPNENFLKILIESKNDIGVIASKTTDGFGLRIRVKPTSKIKQNKTDTVGFLQRNTKQIKSNESSLDSRYMIVVTILFSLLVLMFWIKKRYSNNSAMDKNSWLFKTTSKNQKGIKLIYRKPIDSKNSVVLLEFENRKYLVMSGNSNVLLDTFGGNEVESKGDFEKAFEDNRKKLDDFLKLQDQKLEKYKAKASDDFSKDFEFYK